jgi:hypothetical protein
MPGYFLFEDRNIVTIFYDSSNGFFFQPGHLLNLLSVAVVDEHQSDSQDTDPNRQRA